MADIAGLVQSLAEAGAFAQLVNDPLAQFGPATRKYLGATLLPEKLVPNNEFVEEGITYRTVVANDGTRYSPVQIKGSVLTGTMRVSLGNQDIGSELKGSDYDAVIRLIEQSSGTAGVMGGGVSRPDEMAVAEIMKWADKTLLSPLLEKMEKDRWQAIVNASVVRTGDDGYSETVSYPNPSLHRVAAAGTWSSNSYDPYADIILGAETLAAKGFTVTRMFTGTDTRSKLSNNTKILNRTGKIIVDASNAVVNQQHGRASLSQINEMFSADALPPLELYDLQYRTQTSTGYFLPRGVFVMVATTGRDQAIDRGDAEPLVLPNTLGYQAVGRAAGQSGPGRVVKTESFDRKPPRVEGEGWQTSLPVITEAEAIYVINTIT